MERFKYPFHYLIVTNGTMRTKDEIDETLKNELHGVFRNLINACEGKPSQREIRKQEIKEERLGKIRQIIIAYKLIPDADLKYFEHDINNYKKNPGNLNKYMQQKLENSEVAPVHSLLGSLATTLNEDYHKASKIAKWYAKLYGKDNGWIYINKAHLDILESQK